MTEEDLVKRWEEEHPLYEAWANYVRNEVCAAVSEAIHPRSIYEFLRMPVEPRLKTTSSLVDKAFYRGKKYRDPYGGITDKVGMRFVVLLTTEIKTVERAVCQSAHWRCSKDRDYEEERRQKPLEFTYQSVHFIVRAKPDINVGDYLIPSGTPCEIQIRTLLQHAHSELTHDSIYKPKGTVSPKIARTVAKSMALIEATDEFFEQVMEDLKLASKAERDKIALLQRLYVEYVGREPEVQKSDLLIVNAYVDLLCDDFEATLAQLLEERPYIAERIAKRAEGQHLYRQPAILLSYFFALSSPATGKERWPLTPEELRPIYRDMGLSFDNY